MPGAPSTFWAVNMANSPLSAEATALDVLDRAPGVTVDAGDNLGLRGHQGLLAVTNDKSLVFSELSE